MSREYSFGPKEIPCGANSRLIIAYRADGMGWDVVFYSPRFRGDTIGARFSVTKRILLDALRVMFAEADEPYDADAVIRYMHSTSWGFRLPALEAKREPAPMPQDVRDAERHGWVGEPAR